MPPPECLLPHPEAAPSLALTNHIPVPPHCKSCHTAINPLVLIGNNRINPPSG